MPLTIEARRVDDVAIADCSGRIVFGEETTLLQDRIKALLAETTKIVLNLQNVAYIDSRGLEALVGLYNSARQAGGAIQLCHLMPRVAEVVKITRLDSIFGVYSSEEQAVQAVRSLAA